MIKSEISGNYILSDNNSICHLWQVNRKVEILCNFQKSIEEKPVFPSKKQ